MTIPSINLIIITTLLLLVLLSQFGKRLSARNALSWVFVALFIIGVTVAPNAWKPIANTFGFQLASNFILSSLVFFLFVKSLINQADLTTQMRKLRSSVTNIAAGEFLAKNQGIAAESCKKKVLIVLPCYNEEEMLPTMLAKMDHLSKELSNQFHLQVCFVDDGSTDSTPQILAKSAPTRFVSHSANMGVSGGLMTGFRIAQKANVDYVVQCDSDGQHPIDMIGALVEASIKAKSDLLIGSRYAEVRHRDVMAGKTTQSSTALRQMGSIVIGCLLKLFPGSIPITDPTSGFRVYSRKAIQILLPNMPEEYPEPESIAFLKTYGAKIDEMQVTMLPRLTGVSSLRGLKSATFMSKVTLALVGLRIRTLYRTSDHG